MILNLKQSIAGLAKLLALQYIIKFKNIKIL